MLFTSLPPALSEIVEHYLCGEVPSSIAHAARELAVPPSPTKFDSEADFRMLDAHVNAKSLSYQFHQETVEAGVYGLISLEGAAIIRDIAGGRQICDPLAGRGFLAKALRNLGCNVLAGDHEYQYPVTQVETICAKELITQADEDALIILCWPPRSAIDDEIGKLSGDRDILFIGEQYGCTGSTRFMNRFVETKHIDSPDSILTNINESWILGHYR